MKLFKNKLSKSAAVDGDKIGKTEFFTVQHRILGMLIKKYPKEVLIIFILLVLLSFRSIVFVNFIENISNQVSHMVNGQQTELSSLFKTIVLFIFISCICIGFQWIYNFYSNKFNELVRYGVEQELRETVSHIAYENYEDNKFHEKFYRANEAGAQMGHAIYGCAQFAQIIILLFCYSVTLSKLSILLPIILIVVDFITFFVSSKTIDMQLDYYRKNVAPLWRSMNYFEHITEPLENHQHIQANRLYSYFGNKYSEQKKKYLNNTLRMNAICFVTESFMSVAIILCYVFTLLFVGKKLVNGQVEIGFFVMLFTILLQMFDAIKQYANIVSRGNWYIRTIGDYFDITSLSLKNYEKQEVEEIHSITFEDITYKYPQAENSSLSSCNISFNIGDKIAIVGYNGSGKTTFVNLFMGLLEQYSGNIKINGKIITKEDLLKYSQNVACIFQDFNQYQISIKQNVEIGNRFMSMSDEKVIDILKKVGLYEDVSCMKDGIYTLLGELNYGQELSMGQRQKLAIARLLANENANVWILDEPTAYLDPITEVASYNLIKSLAGDRLVLFISHRLGYAAQSDKIIVFNEGGIVESGNHVALMAQKGIYYNMFEIQKGWYK